jgi:hypothetical protein
MGKERAGPTATTDAILRLLVETVYGPPKEAATRLQALTTVLFTAMVRAPLRLPGSGLALWAIPDGLRFRDRHVDWNLPAAEICADLKRVFGQLAQWKRGLAVEAPYGAATLQSGAPIAVTLRMSLGNEGASPHRHFLALQGSAKDVFLGVTLLLLAQGTTAKVLTCEECDRVFFRANGRQTHCGKKCYDRRYWREKYPPQRKVKARQTEYKKYGWSLGAKGSPLGQLKRTETSKHSSSSKRRRD